jgi:hypothetical protein
MLIGAGESPTDVARRLGHKDASVTMTVYSHWFDKRSTVPLGTRLAAFVKAETTTDGGFLAVLPEQDDTGTRAGAHGSRYRRRGNRWW